VSIIIKFYNASIAISFILRASYMCILVHNKFTLTHVSMKYLRWSNLSISNQWFMRWYILLQLYLMIAPPSKVSNFFFHVLLDYSHDRTLAKDVNTNIRKLTIDDVEWWSHVIVFLISIICDKQFCKIIDERSSIFLENFKIWHKMYVRIKAN